MEYFAIPLRQHGGFLPEASIKQVHSVQVKRANQPCDIVISRAKDTPGLMCYMLHRREGENCTTIGNLIISLASGQFQVSLSRADIEFPAHEIHVAMETIMREPA